jgi:hypothetical protein
MPISYSPQEAGSLIPSAQGQRLVRRAVLLLAALLSGGNLILPRLPLLAALVAAAFLVIRTANFLRSELSRVWIFLLGVLVVSLVGGQGVYLEATAVRYANFFAGLLLVLVYLDLPRRTFVDDILPLLILFSIQSVLTPLLVLLIPEAFITFNINDAVYYTLGFLFTYHETIVTAIKRPDGFFFEPGVLQIYLNLYLFIALFLLRKPFHIGLALAGVLATQSTTGIVVAMALAMAATWEYMRSAGYNNRLIIVILAPVLLAPLALAARQNIEEKLMGTFRGSTAAREYDFQIGVRMVKKYPVFGVGFDYEHYLDVSSRLGDFRTGISAEAASERTSSNGAILLASMLGIPMFLIFMWGLFRQRLLPHKWIAFGFIFLSFIGEALVLTPFFLFFILSGFIVPMQRPGTRAVPPLQRA